MQPSLLLPNPTFHANPRHYPSPHPQPHHMCFDTYKIRSTHLHRAREARHGRRDELVNRLLVGLTQLPQECKLHGRALMSQHGRLRLPCRAS